MNICRSVDYTICTPNDRASCMVVQQTSVNVSANINYTLTANNTCGRSPPISIGKWLKLLMFIPQILLFLCSGEWKLYCDNRINQHPRWVYHSLGVYQHVACWLNRCLLPRPLSSGIVLVGAWCRGKYNNNYCCKTFRSVDLLNTSPSL